MAKVWIMAGHTTGSMRVGDEDFTMDNGLVSPNPDPSGEALRLFNDDPRFEQREVKETAKGKAGASAPAAPAASATKSNKKTASKKKK
jgi:hypothetical protein